MTAVVIVASVAVVMTNSYHHMFTQLFRAVALDMQVSQFSILKLEMLLIVYGL
jgi:hypothetical protein